ncbi:TolC family protein [Pseudomonas sp. NPDC086278]|uniref:TolC family protein n=1 Tax=Pseudomonas sp. NPDC086278 TaxID=3390646 RepID=UPI003D0586F7
MSRNKFAFALLLSVTSMAMLNMSCASAIEMPAGASTSATRSVTLQEALDMAQEHSVRLLIASARSDAAQAGVDGARAAYLPKVQALAKTQDYLDHRYTGYQNSLDEEAQAQVSLQYTVLDFGRRKADSSRTRLDKQSTDFAHAQETEDVRFETVRAYVDAERYRRMLDVARTNLEELTYLTSLMEERVKGGLSPDSELVRSRLALNNAQTRQKNLRQRYDQARLALRSLTGQSVINVPFEIDVDKGTRKLGALAGAAEDTNWALQSLKAQAGSAQMAVERASADRYPRVELMTTYKMPFDSNIRSDMGMNIFLQISVDLFDGGLKRSRISQAGATQREADAQHELMRREIRSQVENLVVDAETAYEQWNLTRVGKEQAERTRQLYMDEFRLGTRSINDLISAQNDAYAQGVENIDTQSNYLLSALGLYHIKGDTVVGLVDFGLVSGDSRTSATYQ